MDSTAHRLGRFLCHALIASACVTLGTAADKSAVGPGAISVPKGPGSIEGLGESFQPSLNTGTAKYGVSLKVPPGTAGHAPSVGLSYEGGGGNGPLGIGWNLPMSYIQCRSDQGIPTYGQNVGFPREDRYINEMKEELVPMAGGYWFSENEGAFVRYQRLGDHWEGTAPDGTKLEFGLTESGRIQDGTNSARVFCWHLERQSDTRGNTILYMYSASAEPQNTNQKYLAEIRYGPGAPPWDNFHFVRFHYEERPDWFEDCRPGFVVRTGLRLKSVVIGTQGPALANHLAGDFNEDGTTDYLVRRYELGYLDYAGTNSHWSLLAHVQLIGADGVTTLPPASFGYPVCNPPDVLSAEGQVIGSLNEPGVVMDNPLVDLVDLNGDGLPDLLETQDNGGAHRGYLNLGQTNEVIVWGAPQEVGAAEGGAWTYNLRSDITEGQSVHLADMDGDGAADLNITSFLGDVYYCANSNRLGWGAIIPMTGQDVAPPSPFGDNQTRTADMDFDKRIDIVQSLSGAYDIWFNLGDHTYSPRVRVAQDPGLEFSDTTVHIADFNGDRIPDLARLSVAALEVSAGLGYGRFAPPVSVAIPDAPLEDFQVAQARLQDITGDGLPELVIERADTEALWYWINLGNYALGPRKVITDMPLIPAPGAVRWADLNGNGATDLIYGDSAAAEGERIRLVDLGDLLNDGRHPNVLSAVSNGIGGVTLIEYVSSTRFSLEDAAAGRPWPDPMPFPVQVIATITNLDSLGHHYVAQFRYHDAYYDPVEKQFRGFASAEQVDVGDPTAPTLVSRSHFDTGRTHEAMKGRLLRLTAQTEDGRVFTDTFTAWTVPPRVLMTGTNSQTVNYVNAVGVTNLVLELGQGTPRRLESEMDYDGFGNQIFKADYGIVENGDRSAFDDERITLAEYAINTEAWILRAPKRTVVQDENGALIARAESFYDDETFSGNNFGSVTIGNLTLQRAWINPSNATDFVPAARTKYDAFGNAIATFDPLSDGTGDANEGHFREFAFDSRFHAYPVRETLHIGDGTPALVFGAAYDEGLATMLSSTDCNGNTTFYAHDALARLTSITKPGDTAAFPTMEYDYALAVPTTNGGIVNFVETRQLDRTPGDAGSKRDHYHLSRHFTDALGRNLMTRTEAEPASGLAMPRVSVSGAALFNARQKPVRTLNPFFTLQSGSLDELLAFESIEAAGWSGLFHDNGSLVALDLAAAHQTSTEYDATLRAIRTTNPDGTHARMEIEPLVTRSFDPNDTDPASPHFNTPTITFSDGLGRLIRVDEMVRLNDDGTSADIPNSWTTRYEYDLNDCLTRITDSQNNTKLMRYDGLKRRTFMNDPDGGMSTNAHDAASNPIKTIDGKGQRITYTYDGANRILTEDYHDEDSPEFSYDRTPDVMYHYDEPAASVDQGDGTRAAARNTKGALAYIEDASGEEHTSFDNRGRVEWTIKRIVDPLLTNRLSMASYRTSFEYDSADRVTRMIYPDNDQVAYRYNARNLLERIIGGPTGDIIPSVNHLPSAQLARCDFGNGVSTTYAYDARSRLTQLATINPQIATELIRYTYDFDAVSNIKAIHDQRAASAVPLADQRRNSQAFVYDDLYRLTRAQFNPSNGSAQSATNAINYRYDRLGNMMAQTSDIHHLEKGVSVTDLGSLAYGGASGSSGRVGRTFGDPPGPHALTSVTALSNNNVPPRTYSYDANGNMKEIDGLRCTWDFLDRLVGVEDDAMRAEYTYDYGGRRIIKAVMAKQPTSDQGRLTTIYVGQHFEVREHDQPTKYVFNGNTRVARIIGTLSANIRIQRLRLRPGWNLLSLAVSASNLPEQWQASGLVTSVFAWDAQTGGYAPLSPGSVPAGTVLWVNAVTNGILSVAGTYSDPVNRLIPPGATYLASTGLESWTPIFPPTMAVWSYPDHGPLVVRDSGDFWHSRLAGPLSIFNELPRTFAPGQALFINHDSPAELDIPDPALRIRYYHQDHLGSSSVMTDSAGHLVEETSFYPFGIPRHEHRPRPVEEAYKFTQKEHDRESGLHCFESRYLAGGLARFITPDPFYASPNTLAAEEAAVFLAAPQKLNLYAYARNNPLNYVDPTGLDDEDEGFDMWDLVQMGAAEVARATRDDPRERAFTSFVVGASDELSWGMGGSYQVLRPVIVEAYKVDTDSGAYTAGEWSGKAVTIAATLFIPGPKGPTAAPGTVTLYAKTPVAPALLTNPSISSRAGTATPVPVRIEPNTRIRIGKMETLPHEAGPTMIPATGGPRVPTQREIILSDPVNGPILRRLDANRARLDRLNAEGKTEEAGALLGRIFQGLE